MEKMRIGFQVVILAAALGGCVTATPEPTETVEPDLLPYRTATPTPNPAITLEALVEPTRIDPTPTPWVHIVQQNDTLLGIANRYGVTLDELLLANPDIDPRLLTIDQEIIIPGPEGGTGPVVLPTPTPLPMDVSPVSCYPIPSGGTWCIVSVINSSAEAVEGISLSISLLDSNGEVLESRPAYSPHNILPPGARMPIAIQFVPSPPETFIPVARLQSAIRSGEISGRYVLPTVSEVQSSFLDNARQLQLSGSVSITGLDQGSSMNLSLLAMGIDANGQVVGYTKWEVENVEGDQTMSFQMSIISLGPAIVDYEILAEGRLINP